MGMTSLGGVSKVRFVYGGVDSGKVILWKVEVGNRMGLGGRGLKQPMAGGAHMATLFSTRLGRRYS